jgi:hypothetical protein
MALQFSVDVRDARLDAIEAEIGTGPVLNIYSGSMPANCAASATGDLLCSITLPSDWLAAASSGAKSKSGTWADVGADDGTAGYFRVYESTETTAHIQGECTDTGGAGPLKLSTTTIVTGEPVTVVTFTLTDGNA